MSSPTSPTDSLLRRVTRAIERRRARIDQGAVARVEIIVRFNARTGYPEDPVEYRSAEHDRECD